MRTREIPRAEWMTFFEGFSRRHEGWIASLEVFGPDTGAQTEERALPLKGVTAELREGDDDSLQIMFGTGPDDHVTHSITHPVGVSLQQTEEGADAVLAIKAADGVMALLNFRSAVLPELVDDFVM
jgi:hypothetical protein